MILIQVPAVPERRSAIARRSEPGATRRPPAVRRAGGRPRRRLRREIRMAAFAGLAFGPMFLAAGLWSLHASRPLAAAEVSTRSRSIERSESLSDGAPAAILMSIESAGGVVDAEREAPVVFPGYLLPEDPREEAVHEGS